MRRPFVFTATLINLVSATVELCGQFQTYGKGNLIVNNNAWNQDQSGSVCTYTDEVGEGRSANLFSAIWQWSTKPVDVRAYPNVQYNSHPLPLRLKDLDQVLVNISWSLGYATVSAGSNAAAEINQIATAGVQADVAFDMFLDEQPNTTTGSSKDCQYEIMIWLGRYGDKTRPIGNTVKRDPPLTETVNGIEFTLINGTNDNGQTVFTWVADSNITDPSMDIAPLIKYLPRHGLIPFSVYLGPIHFGSETFYSKTSMNFTVHDFSLEVKEGKDNESVYELPKGSWKDHSKDPNYEGGATGLRSVGRFGSWWMMLTIFLAFVRSV